MMGRNIPPIFVNAMLTCIARGFPMPDGFHLISRFRGDHDANISKTLKAKSRGPAWVLLV
jgi:hypothetical protein